MRTHFLACALRALKVARHLVLMTMPSGICRWTQSHLGRVKLRPNGWHCPQENSVQVRMLGAKGSKLSVPGSRPVHERAP